MAEDSDPAGPPADPASEALQAAKAAAMAKVKDAAILRRQHDSAAAAGRRAGARRPRPSGDRTEWSEPTTFGEAVDELLDVRGWASEVTIARVLTEWETVVGPELAGKTEPVSLVSGVLTLQAESTAWATQVRLLAPTIIAAVEHAFGPGVVTSITARGPSGPPSRPGAWKVRGGRGPRDTYG